MPLSAPLPRRGRRLPGARRHWEGDRHAGPSRGIAQDGDRHAAPPRGGPSPRRAQAVAGAVSARLPFCSKRPVKFHAPSCSPTHFPAPRFPGTWHSLGPGAAPQSGSRKGVGAPRTSLTGSPPPAARAWRSRGVSNPASVSGCGAPVPAPPLGSKKLSPSGPSRRVRPLAGHQTQAQPLRPQPLPFLTFNRRRLSQPGRLGRWGARPPQPPSRLAGRPAPLLPGPHVENRPLGAGGPPARAAAAWTADVGRPSPRTSRAPRSPPLPHVYSVCRTSQGPPACRRREGGEL